MLKLINKAFEFNKRQEQSAKATRLILERNLTEEELSEYANLYDNWESILEGTYIKELSYIRYKDILYQCLKGMGHEKDNNISPDTSKDTYKVVNPQDLLPEWDPIYPYDKGVKVVYQKQVWISNKPNTTSEPGSDSSWIIV